VKVRLKHSGKIVDCYAIMFGKVTRNSEEEELIYLTKGEDAVAIPRLKEMKFDLQWIKPEDRHLEYEQSIASSYTWRREKEVLALDGNNEDYLVLLNKEG
jgi:hypothetical protein